MKPARANQRSQSVSEMRSPREICRDFTQRAARKVLLSVFVLPDNATLLEMLLEQAFVCKHYSSV